MKKNKNYADIENKFIERKFFFIQIFSYSNTAL